MSHHALAMSVCALPLLLAHVLLREAAGASFPPDAFVDYEPPPPCRCANRSQADCATAALQENKAVWSWADSAPADGDKAEQCVKACRQKHGSSKYVKFGIVYDECNRQYDAKFDQCVAKYVARGKYGCWTKEDMMSEYYYPPMDGDDYPPGGFGHGDHDWSASEDWSEERSGEYGPPYDPCQVYWDSETEPDATDRMYGSMQSVDEYGAALCRAERRTVLAYDKCVQQCYEYEVGEYDSYEQFDGEDYYDDDPITKACGCEPKLDARECYDAVPETFVCDCMAKIYRDLKCTAADGGGGGAQREGAATVGRRRVDAAKHRRPPRHKRR